MTPNLLDELVPRAWMLRIGDSDVWSYCEQEWMADFYGRKSGTKYEKNPLYDAPVLADMAKRLEAAERDAARYAFLRDKQATIIYKRKGHGVWEPLIDTRETSTRCASLDEAVDAAIAATQEGEG